MKIQLHGVDGDIWAYNAYRHGKSPEAGSIDPAMYTCVMRAYYCGDVWEKQMACKYAVVMPYSRLDKFHLEYTITWEYENITGDYHCVKVQDIIDGVFYPVDAHMFIFEHECDATIFKLRWA